jgi:hypothetical protein
VMHFRGLRILEASLQKLGSLGLSRATTVLLTGFSHGGTMVLLHADRVRASLRKISQGLVHFGALTADAAHPDYPSLWRIPFPTLGKGWYAPAMRAMAELTDAANATAPECLVRHAMDPSRCLFASEAMDWVQTPVFAVQQVPSTWDLQCNLDGQFSGDILQVGCATHNNSMLPLTKCVQYCDRCNATVVREYMVPLQNQLLHQFKNSKLAFRRSNGGFYHHCYVRAACRDLISLIFDTIR